MKKFKVWFISASTGCTCCSSENHYRGPYKTKEDAERRINYYRTSDQKTGYWPLASQFSRRGNYSVYEIYCEPISDDRFIIGEERVVDYLSFVEVNEDGSVKGSDNVEYFSSELYVD